MHTYLTLTLFMFLTLLESLLIVIVVVLKERDQALLCFHLIIKLC